ncbi:hypothetical protein [Mesorhizobium sp. P13.3]
MSKMGSQVMRLLLVLGATIRVAACERPPDDRSPT